MLFRPVYELMHQHAKSPVRNGLDGSFADSILEVSTDSTVGNGLVVKLEVFLHFFRLERVIVCMKGSHLDAELFSMLLELMFTLDSVSGAK